MTIKTLRRAQTVTPFGVGSLLDVNGEGFVVESIDKWVAMPRKLIELPRLSQLLGNAILRSFDDNSNFSFGNQGNDSESLKVSRFPRWYHCAKCKKLVFYSKQIDRDLDGNSPQCQDPRCKHHAMSPMRFVAYCDKGHLSEIDWFSWCHRSGDATRGRCSDRTQLYFRTSGKHGGDFNSMKVHCAACDRKENLTDIQRGTAFPWVLQNRPPGEGKCCGKQPWQYPNEAIDCDQSMKIEPRGSSSVYRAKVFSALDIDSISSNEQPDIDYSELDKLFEFLQEENYPSKQLFIHAIKDPNGHHSSRIYVRAERVGVSYDEAVSYLVRLVESDGAVVQDGETEPVENAQEVILVDELKLFQEGRNVDSNNLSLRFLRLDVEEHPQATRVISSIGQVKRLREVRALTSFQRGKGLSDVLVDQGQSRRGWLPSIEAFGEGIYFELNQETLKNYFSKHGNQVNAHVRRQQDALKAMQDVYPVDYPESTLFILAHSLSHLLIRQLTFNSGYSSSALRERLYVDADSGYAGILIYTTDTDSEGTLGGLVDQGRVEVIAGVLKQVREAALWCSADPVCRETESQGFHSLNRSACHCCSLVSETSCMFQNALLNRLTLGGMGSHRNEVLGFLEYAMGKGK